jgi:type III restriction enzyme
MLELKTYQQHTVDALRNYLRDCLVDGAKHAFIERTERPYKEIKELPGIPYVCLRIPTGGGKTLVACYAVTTVARELVRTEKPLVLWLVPTNAIREQTLKALRDRHHAYRQALEELGLMTALDIKEALAVSRSTLDTGTTVIVSTLQAFRVDDTEGRKVYETNGSLQPLFSNVNREVIDPRELREDGSYP